jgi:hypothetical protein
MSIHLDWATLYIDNRDLDLLSSFIVLSFDKFFYLDGGQ